MESEHISEIIRFASIASVAFPMILYLTKIGYGSKALHLIGALVVLSALSDLTAYFLFSHGKSTVILFNLYYIAVFFVLTGFYLSIYNSSTGRRVVISGFFIYVIALILVTLFRQPFTTYQTLMWTLTGMTMIIYSISYFLYLFSDQTMMNNYGLLWINSGVLLYFSLNLFLFIMSSYVLTQLDSEISLLIWSFHNVNNIMKNVLIGLGIFSFSKHALTATTARL
jgi:hypothetical protein